MNTDSSYPKWLYCLGLIPTIWLALLIAPSVNGGLPQIMKDFSDVIGNPFHITWSDNSIKVIIVFIIGYVMAITIYLSTKKNYRRREEHGSARWGNANEINKKYKQLPMDRNKLLTQNVCIGLNGKKHRRNLNVLVCGGSGAGKTRFYCKPNVMQCNTSMVILDPKGEIVRDTGKLLKKKGYEVKVLDLINMEKSHCYNPFVYLKNDNDVQKLVTNLFKSTTPKGSQSNDPFWDTAASMLLLALVFYLKYEAPEDEQNFPMVMELLRAGEVHEDDDVFTCAFITSCFTGMRPGELCALTWEDIDFESKVINVRHSVFDKKKNENGRWYIGTTKTKSGERQIHISPTLMKALVNFKNKQMELRLLYGKDYKYYHLEEVKNQYGKVLEYQIVENQSNILSMKPLNMVFTRDDGKYCGTDIIKYPYKIIHKELGIENCRFYDLRGSYATTILRNGVEIRDVADVLGHKDIETTENYYISSTDETRKNVTDSYENAINLDVIEEIIEYKISI